MIRNRNTLIALAPIRDMAPIKISQHGVTYGLSEAGYDIRLAQRVAFTTIGNNRITTVVSPDDVVHRTGRFALASAIEEFQMPNNLVGIVHDKSTWARRGLSVFNTVIEPGWNGFLTLELVYHGEERLIIPAGAGIAQVVFHHTTDAAEYSGRYQDQANEPVSAKST